VNTKIVQVKNLSLATAEELQSGTPSFQCPCTELSVSYENIIDLEPTYHQICSSDFVSPIWIEGLNEIVFLSIGNFYYADFRFSGPIFQLLKFMYDLANDTIVNTFFSSITRLDASQRSRFMINTTIAELLGQLFIESWSSNLSYTSYFTKC
jgi:hypothetical protein